MKAKKYTNSSWTEGEYEKEYSTATDTYTTLPATFQTSGADVENYQVYGASSGVGEETENLFTEEGSGLIQVTGSGDQRFGKSLGKLPAGDYDLSYVRSGEINLFVTFKENGDTYRGTKNNPTAFTVLSTDDEVIIRTSYASDDKTWAELGFTDIVVKISGYKIPILCQSKIVTDNLFDKNATDANNGYVDGYHLISDGTTRSNSSWAISEYMPITGGLNYTFNYGSLSSSPAICYYDSDKHFISGVPYGGQSPKNVSVPQNISYIRFSFMKSYVDDIMFVQANSLPDHYIPHFYQSNYDLFIGDSKLYEDEYVDYQEQKIYKDVSGTLTPTDPPAPFPALSTYIGENNLSVDTTVQPEKVMLTVAAWRKIEAKKYVNEEWSDNNDT